MADVVANLGCIAAPRDGDAASPALIGFDLQRQESRLTYADLGRLADGIAAGLLARGYRPGERIALLSENSVAVVATLLGCLRAGLIAVPVNHRFPAETIAWVLEDCGARGVFHDRERKVAVPESLDAFALDEAALAAFSEHVDYAPFAPGERDPALILYTSGSTGRPKGVLLSHAAQRWVVETRRADTPLEEERALIAAPLYHMNALALVLLVLASGATAILLPRFDARLYLESIARYRATWLTAVPPMMAMMLREREALARADLASVRVVRMGSAPVSPKLLAQIGDALPNARVINAYGTTEGGPVVFSSPPGTPPSSLGVAHPAVSIRLRGADGSEGERGMLEMKSPGSMLGYYRREHLHSPFTEDGYYVTGDIFERDSSGFYTFVGRDDDMFVCGGENVWPGEVERLLERHPGVQQACVVAVEDDIKGHKPVAFVVTVPGQEPDENELKAFTLEHGPAYRHPRRIWRVAALPLAATGKVDRRQLEAEALQHLGEHVS